MLFRSEKKEKDPPHLIVTHYLTFLTFTSSTHYCSTPTPSESNDSNLTIPHHLSFVSLYFVTLSAKPVHLSATNRSKFKPKYLPPPFSCCFSYLPKFYSTHKSLKVSPNLIHYRSKISQNEEEKSLNPLVHLDKVTAASIRE